MNTVLKECSNCGKASSPPYKLKACGRCKQTRYCSENCQRFHWKKGGHKDMCGQSDTTNCVCTPEVNGVPLSATQQLTAGVAIVENNTNTNSDDPVNPCPICLTNEDDFGDGAQCCKCGQLFCGECKTELVGKSHPNCPMCRAPFSRTVTEDFDNLFSLLHDRTAGRHTLVAQFNLGFMYQNGVGVFPDHALAAKYFKLAADSKCAGQGHAHARAQFCLGVAYTNGDGVKQDRVLGVRYYTLAADQGHAQAQCNVSDVYARGQGVQHDPVLSAKYTKLAADQGVAVAQSNLGFAYAKGNGVQQDQTLAAKYHKLAADQGYVTAQYSLGLIYRIGIGVQQDSTAAAKYFKLAAKQGFAGAITVLESVFMVGTRVQVTGLTSNSDLNGATGTVTKGLSNGRAVVVLDGQTKLQSIRHLNLDPA